MRFASGLVAFAALSLCLACAEGGGGNADASMRRDGSTPPDGGTANDAGRRDGGSGVCGAGQHRCGSGCVDDLPNEPENGCRFGCGEPCSTPPDGRATCTADGTCSFACEPPFFQDGPACVCRARTCDELGWMCGNPDDGCGTALDCGTCGGGGICMSGSCSCPLDAREPNNGRLQAAMVGSLTDAPDSSATYSDFTLHSGTDQDWFTIAVEDAFDAGNPQIRVTLDRIPAGSDYELTAWYICGTGSDQSDCTVASPCTNRASGTSSETIEMATECGGTTDESGTLWLQVIAPTWGGSCAAYRLRVDVN
jgi:hypothetical protein